MIILIISALVLVIILLFVTICKLSERNATLERTANHYKDLYEQEKAKAKFYARQFKEEQK